MFMPMAHAIFRGSNVIATSSRRAVLIVCRLKERVERWGGYSAIVERADVHVGLGGASVAVAVCRLHHISNLAASRDARHVLTEWSIFFRFQTIQLCTACSS